MDLSSPVLDVNGMDLVLTISLQSLQGYFKDKKAYKDISSTNIGPNDFEYVASYNWLQPAESARRDRKLQHPIIVIPGAPMRFVRWNGGKLDEDKESAFADENRYFMGEYPMEPLFRAVLHEGFEPLAFQTLDVVTDRNNLRRLYEFCKYRNVENARRPLPFCIKIERIGSRLIVFEQCSQVEYTQRNTPIYGRQFEQLCTKAWSDLTRGAHYSILKYWLDKDLCCLVRCNPDCAKDWEDDANPTALLQKVGKPIPFPDSNLRYIEHGHRKYDHEYIEMTTRIDDGKFPDYVWDQLYFGRASHVYIGWHKEGHCQYPQQLSQDDLRERLENKTAVPLALTSLRSLLKRLIESIRHRSAGERYVLCYDATPPDQLRLYKSKETAESAPEGGILPPSLKALLEEKPV